MSTALSSGLSVKGFIVSRGYSLDSVVSPAEITDMNSGNRGTEL